MQIRVRHALTILVVVCTVACTTTRPLPCVPGQLVRAPRNFGEVLAVDGRPTAVYRGGQPDDCGQLEYLRSLGVKSILKLNDRGLEVDAVERKQAAELGMQFVSFPFSALTIGRPASCALVREALAVLSDPDRLPVYVHCTAGKDRTGYIIGLYEKLVLGKTSADVVEELRRYGHRGVRSLLMPQIDHELSIDKPVCAP